MPDQLHDLNPSGPVPTGLFWTIAVPAGSATADLAQGRALLAAEDVPILDHGSIPNALTGMGPPPRPGTVSFRVEWRGEGPPEPVRNAAQGFAAELVRGTAQMAWTARVGSYDFVSAPLSTSESAFAEFGRERNGVFYR
jgi:hypothetical protein